MTRDLEEPGRLRTGAALLIGIVTLAVAVHVFRRESGDHDVATWMLLLPLVAATLGPLVASALGSQPRLHHVPPILVATAMLIGGLGEYPNYASAGWFGMSRLFVVVASTLLGIGSFMVVRIPARRGFGFADAGLFLYVLVNAFDCRLFVRGPHVSFPLLALLAAVVLICIRAWPSRGIWSTPFLKPLLALIVLAIPAGFTGADADLHWTWMPRLALVAFPMLALAAGPPAMARARLPLYAIAITVCAGLACVLLVIIESGWHFDLELALRTRLRLFRDHPNLVAPYFTLALPLLVGLLASARWWQWILLLAGIAGSVFTLHLTQSRSSLMAGGLGIGLFAGLSLAVFVYRRFPRKVTVVALVAVTLAASTAGGYLLRHKIEGKLRDPAMQFRFYYWNTALRAIEDRPLFGYGFGNSDALVAYAEHSDLDGQPKGSHTHNLPLAIALAAGIPAAIAFLCLLGWFAVRLLAAAARLRRFRERALALALIASAGSLFFSNQLDMGLAVNTPIPLPLGVLIGVGSLIVRRASPRTALVSAPASAPPAGAAPRPAFHVAPKWATAILAGVTLLTLHLLVVSRLAVEREARRSPVDPYPAFKLAKWTYWLDPFSVANACKYALYLDMSGNDDASEALLRQTIRRHPLNTQPVEQLASFELKRKNDPHYEEALELLQRCEELDPTGARLSDWKIHSSLIHMRLKHRDEALAELADAFLINPDAAHGVPWIHSGQSLLYLPGTDDMAAIPIGEIFVVNRERLGQVVRKDAVAGRRAATTLVKNYMSFGWYAEARKVIKDYEALTDVPWTPLKLLEREMDRLEKTGKDSTEDDAALPPPAADPDAEVVPSDLREDKDFGGASLPYLEGRAALDHNDLEGARTHFLAGIRLIQDLVLEEMLAERLVNEMFEVCLRSDDPKELDHWQRAVLYFRSGIPGRADVLARRARRELERGNDDAAVAWFASTVELFRDAAAPHADTAADQVRGDLCRLVSPTAPPDVRTKVEAIFHARGDRAGVLYLNSVLFDSVNRRIEAAKLRQQIRAEHPGWLELLGRKR